MRSKYSALMDYLTKQWISSEACDGQIEGCSEAEVLEVMHAQGVEHLPVMYIEFLTHLGRKSGGLEGHFGSEITYPGVCIFKPMTFAHLRQSEIFVFSHNYQGDCSFYFSIIDDDPVLYWAGYGYSPGLGSSDIPLLETKELGRLSDYLTNFIADVIEEHKIS